MPVKDLHAKPFDEATLIKLDIFELYLKEWLPVFIKTPYHSEANIIDFFAGSGSDSVGKPGSPLRIVRAISVYKSLIQSHSLKVNVAVNEMSKAKFKSLCDSLAKQENAGISKLEKYNKPFRDLFYEMKDGLKKSANLIFIDQNGVKEVDKELFLEMCSFEHTDFLFFVSSSFAKRFHEQEEFRKHLGWMGNDPFKNTKPQDVHRVIINHYKKLAGNRLHLIPFSIKKGRNIYGLIFCSRSSLAAEKFLDVLWKLNETNGEANFDIDDDASKAQGDFFTRKLTKLEAFHKDLQTYVCSRQGVTNKDVFHFAIDNGFRPKHASDALKEMRSEKVIEHFTYAYIGYRQCYKDGKLVTFKARRT